MVDKKIRITVSCCCWCWLLGKVRKDRRYEKIQGFQGLALVSSRSHRRRYSSRTLRGLFDYVESRQRFSYPLPLIWLSLLLATSVTSTKNLVLCQSDKSSMTIHPGHSKILLLSGGIRSVSSKTEKSLHGILGFTAFTRKRHCGYPDEAKNTILLSLSGIEVLARNSQMALIFLLFVRWISCLTMVDSIQHIEQHITASTISY